MRAGSSTLAVLIGLGGLLVATLVHFIPGASDKKDAQPPPQAAAVISPFTPRASVSGADAQTETTRLSEPRAAAFAGSAAVVPRRAESDADPADVPVSPADFPKYDESAIELAVEHKLPAERSGIEDVNARATALREMDTASADSVSLLEQTLRSDPAARNRLLAVSSLRRYGMQAGNAERARTALRLALTDADQNVSTSAREAYEELAR